MVVPESDEVPPLEEEPIEKLGTGDLAALVVDALLRAGVVAQSDVVRAIQIATEEIEARKLMGDY